jgi:hypothetical protein
MKYRSLWVASFMKRAILLLPVFFLLLAAPASAALSDYLPILDPQKQCSGTLTFPEGEKYCTLCDGLNAVKRIINFAILLGAAIAVIIVAYGGILIMVSGASPAQYAKGVSAITGALVGVGLAFGGWLIVNQVFYIIVKKDVTGRPWNQITCPAEVGFGAIPSGDSGTGDTSGQNTGTVISGDTRVRGTFAENDIGVNKACSASGGTCLGGVSEKAISGAISLKKNCNCDVVVTGGTERTGGHAGGGKSHLSGDKLDFRKNAGVDGYIIGNFERIPNRGDGAPQWRDNSTGNIYADEGSHWDVLY